MNKRETVYKNIIIKYLKECPEKIEIENQAIGEEFTKINSKLNTPLNIVKYFGITIRALEKLQDVKIQFTVKMFKQAIELEKTEWDRDKYIETKNAMYLGRMEKRIRNFYDLMKELITKYPNIFNEEEITQRNW